MVSAVVEDDDASTPLPGLSQACKRKLEQQTSVAVVGGGFAGLAAGLRLSRHGVKVTVYEPRTQWGGRVRSNSSFADGRIIEFGAELIGSFHTAWLKLAQHYGIAMINRMGETEYERERLNLKLRLDNDLTWQDVKAVNEKVDKVLKVIAIDARNVRQETCPWKETDQRLRKELERWDNTSVADVLRIDHHVPNDPELWNMLKLKLVNDEVAPLERMNYLGLLCKVKGGQNAQFELDDPDDPDAQLMRYWTELEIFRCADGCQSLANKMKDEIGRRMCEDRTAVTQINIRTNNVELITQKVRWINSEKNKPEKKYELGPKEKAEADYVVLAIPPTVWSDVRISVNGGSPEDLEAYVGGKMGNDPAVKFFSGLSTRFWITEEAVLHSPRMGKVKVRGFAPSGGTLTLGQIWEGTDNQTQARGQGIVLSVFAGPIKFDNKTAIWRAPKQSEMEKDLRDLYKGYKANLIPGKTIYQNWPEEPFIKTGYWSPRTDGEILRVGPQLTKPFRDRLFFAGEHTYPSFFGYMEGALRSGIRAANMVMSQACGLRPEDYACPPVIGTV